MYDVTAMGELLIDFTPAGLSPAGNSLFERNPGGAPANVLAALARLGGKGCFIGKVGNDQFGRYLAGVLEANGVSAGGLVYSDEANTTLAFVHLDAAGNRSFSFYRKPGADLLMTFEEVNTELIGAAKIFHFGAVSLSDGPARSACLRAADYARGKNVTVSFDPNWRPPLWKSDSLARKWMLDAVRRTDILKVSEEEMGLLTGVADPAAGSEALCKMGPSLVFITMGAEGCYFRCGDGSGRVPPYPAAAVDSTGAGDAFTAGVLYRFTRQEKAPHQLSANEVARMAAFANAAGALCVQKRGGIPAMPYRPEVESLIRGS
jgi:fructokinase